LKVDTFLSSQKFTGLKAFYSYAYVEISSQTSVKQPNGEQERKEGEGMGWDGIDEKKRERKGKVPYDISIFHLTQVINIYKCPT
jgi:hypothetical protein